jgi:TfoX/Sxy family transcriptional regulator of competence genes
VATDKDFVNYVIDQSGLGDALTYKKMFGEYGLYHGGKIVALACDNSLFVKPSSASKQLAPNLSQRSPYPGAKKYAVADELLDDPSALGELLLATSAALPLPKPKAPRRSRGKKTPAA